MSFRISFEYILQLHDSAVLKKDGKTLLPRLFGCAQYILLRLLVKGCVIDFFKVNALLLQKIFDDGAFAAGGG